MAHLRPVAPDTPATVAAAVGDRPDRNAFQNPSRTDAANSASSFTPLPRKATSNTSSINQVLQRSLEPKTKDRALSAVSALSAVKGVAACRLPRTPVPVVP